MNPHPFGDCCPACLTADSKPVEPHTVQVVNPPHVRALYRCPSCGHSWWTGWDAEHVLGQRTEGGAA